MTTQEAIAWAKTAAAGDTMIAYEDSGLTDQEDPGSRCGFGDDELAEIESVLSDRGLTLSATDVGLVAAEVG